VSPVRAPRPNARLTYPFVPQSRRRAFAAENDFQRPAATDEMWERSVPPPHAMQPTPLRVGQTRFSRDAKRMSQARTNSLLTPRTQPRIFAMLTTGDLVRRTNVSIRIGRPEGPTAVVMFPSCRSNQSGQGRSQDSRSRIQRHAGSGGIHSSEEILEPFEYGGVYNVERRVFEQNPPVRRRFLDDPHMHR